MGSWSLEHFTRFVQVLLILTAVPYAGLLLRLLLNPASDKTVRNERRKLTATYLNTMAAGLAVTGVVGPVATYVYGSARTDHEPWKVALEIVGLFGASMILHGIARRWLGGLEP